MSLPPGTNITPKHRQAVTKRERDGQARCALCNLPLGKVPTSVCPDCRRHRREKLREAP